MKTKFMAAAAVAAILAASGAARADDLPSIKGAGLPDPFEPILKAADAIFIGDAPACAYGVCLFGTYDIGAGWASHRATLNPDLYFGNVAVNKANTKPGYTVVPSGLSQTAVGLKGEHLLFGDVAGVFKASTGINPQSLRLANAPGSLADNNGTAAPYKSLNADGTRGGEFFNDELYAGLSSKSLGTLIFGRQKALSNETFAAFDPAGYAYNYSLIGLSGTPVAGGGVTDDGRLDDALKYRVAYGPVHFGALYKFVDGSAGVGAKDANWAYQFNLGGEYAGFAVDVVGGHFNQTITYGVLSAAQLAASPNSYMLTGTAADTNDIMVALKYTWNQWKFFGGVADDIYNNPKNPIAAYANTGQGDYVVSPAAGAVSNTAFPHTRTLITEWVGAKYAYNQKLDLTLSYYHEGQNDYGARGACVAAASQAALSKYCAGQEQFVSFYADYHFTKRFDVYGGLTVSAVTGGMASGFTFHNETDWAPTAGIRYTF